MVKQKSLHSACRRRPPCLFLLKELVVVSCSHQAFGDVVRHCKAALHIKFKDEMNRQHKIEKPDDLVKKKLSLLEFRLSRDKF